MKQINQGDIYLANLNPTKGHEQSGLRPVLILQNNILNRNLNTVVVAPITSNLESRWLTTTFFIPKSKTKLKKDSVALLFQIRTLDKSRLIKEVGRITRSDFANLRIELVRIFW